MDDKPATQPTKTGELARVGDASVELARKGVGGWLEGIGDRTITRVLTVIAETAAIGTFITAIKEHLSTSILAGSAALATGLLFYLWDRHVMTLRRRVVSHSQTLDRPGDIGADHGVSSLALERLYSEKTRSMRDSIMAEIEALVTGASVVANDARSKSLQAESAATLAKIAASEAEKLSKQNHADLDAIRTDIDKMVGSLRQDIGQLIGDAEKRRLDVDKRLEGNSAGLTVVTDVLNLTRDDLNRKIDLVSEATGNTFNARRIQMLALLNILEFVLMGIGKANNNKPWGPPKLLDEIHRLIKEYDPDGRWRGLDIEHGWKQRE